MWFVEYEVEGFGKQKAGPFERKDVHAQRADIADFEGVTNAIVVWSETSTRVIAPPSDKKNVQLDDS